MLQATAAVGVGIVLAVVATNGTYAFLNASKPIAGAVVVTAGSASLTPSAAAISLTKLYPGQTAQAEFTVTNTGSVPLALGLASITGFGATGTTATLAVGACVTGNPQVAGTGGTLNTLVSTGTSATLCLRASMPSNAPASAINKSATLTVALTGVQQ